MAFIGIDLGTTFSEAAIAMKEDQQIKTQICHGVISHSECISSSVCFPRDDAGNKAPLVGDMIDGNYLDPKGAPGDTMVKEIKRLMGRRKSAITTPSGKMLEPEAISALILKYVKHCAETDFGEDVTDAVITVPAYFGDKERTATKQAGRIAGLNVRALLNEPTAAALAFGAHKKLRGRILVYDLGGGTFDVTLMDCLDNKFTIIGTSGDKMLGGHEFTQEIYDFLLSDMKDKYDYVPNNTELRRYESDWWGGCELAKRKLSVRATATITYVIDGSPCVTTITRAQFNKMTAPLLRKTQVRIAKLLKDTKKTWESINEIIMVGGSTYMAMIPEMLERISGGKKPIRNEPQLDVVKGAAIYARQLEFGDKAMEDTEGTSSFITLTDVTSKTLGTELYKDDTDILYNEKMIERNSTLPAHGICHPKVRNSGQTSSLITVLEGESSDPKLCTPIGEGTINRPPYKKGHELEYVYRYDVDQLIHVEVFDHGSGYKGEKLGEFDIKRNGNLSEQEVQELVQWASCIDFG
mgnify:CR=1 FL=1